MNIEVCHASELKKYLRDQLRDGCKWICFPEDKYKLTISDLTAFRDFTNVVAFATSRETPSQLFQPIFNIQRALNADHGKPVNWQKLAEQMAKYPIQPFFPHDLKTWLPTGNLFPVFLDREIDPAMEILDYRIYSRTENGYEIREAAFHDEVNLIGAFTNYQKADQFFNQYIEECSKEAVLLKPDLTMIAAFRHQKPQLDDFGRPHYNSALLLKQASPRGSEHKPKYLITGSPDVDSLWIRQPVLAKFNTQNSKLEFFNGQLERVSPCARIQYLPLRNFSAEKVQISEWAKQTITGEDVTRKQQKISKRRL
jgi:hypothetical protein